MQASDMLLKPRRDGRNRLIGGFILILPAMAAVALLGCGKESRKLAPLTGKVTFEGKPLQFGAVILEHDHGQPATARIRPDGTFTMATDREGAGAAVGKWRVCVTCYENQDPNKEFPAGGPPNRGRLLIPARYTSFSTSGLTVEVHSGSNEPLILNLTK